jgi:hypothetical protein
VVPDEKEKELMLALVDSGSTSADKGRNRADASRGKSPFRTSTPALKALPIRCLKALKHLLASCPPNGNFAIQPEWAGFRNAISLNDPAPLA